MPSCEQIVAKVGFRFVGGARVFCREGAMFIWKEITTFCVFRKHLPKIILYCVIFCIIICKYPRMVRLGSGLGSGLGKMVRQ